MIILPELGNSSRTPQSPLVNPNAAASAGRASAQLGQSIAGVGDVAAGIALDVQRAENFGDKTSVMRKVSEKQAEFDRGLISNHDWRSYKKGAQNLIAEARGMVSPEMPPTVREELTAKIDDWASDLLIRTDAKASAKAIERANGELKILTNRALLNGSIDSAIQGFQEAEHLTPEERTLGIEEVRNKHEQIQKKAITEEAIALGNVDFFEDYPPAEKLRYQNQAKRVRQSEKSEALTMIDNIVEAGGVTEQKLKASLEAVPFIEPWEAEKVLANWKQGSVTAEDKLQFQQTIDQLADVMADPKSDRDEYFKAFYETDAALTGYGDSGTYLREQLRSLSPRQFDQQRADAISQKAKEASKVIRATIEAEPETRKKLEEEGKFDRIEKEIGKWMRANPNADDKEIKSEIERVKTNVFSQSLLKSGNSYQKRYSNMGKVSVNSRAHKKRSDIPYNGTAASIRYNNPLAAYPREADNKYGLQGYGVLNGGKQGTHQIGRFPSPVHGAAANIDLLASKYKGLTLKKAIGRWRGNVGRGEKIVIPKGFNPDEVITDSFLANQDRASDFFKQMASHETGNSQALSDDQWKQAWQMWKQGGANA